MKPADKNQSKIYQFMDRTIAFSVCNLNGATHPGDCLCPIKREENWKNVYYCGANGIHFHCGKHVNVPLYKKKIQAIESSEIGNLEVEREVWWCDKCEVEDSGYKGHLFDEEEQTRRARAFVTSEEYKNAQVIRIDDQVVQIDFNKHKVPKGQSDYYTAWGNIETDRDGNPQLNLYVALKSMNGKKAHYFIEPELGRLREEVREMDIDPGEIISKIEITARKSKISKEYKNELTTESKDD